MNERIKITDLEITQQDPELSGLAGYAQVKCLLRLQGTPLGWLDLPVRKDRIRKPAFHGSQFKKIWDRIIHEILLIGLLNQNLSLSKISAILDADPGINESDHWPSLTVAVCTRDRYDDLKRCLGAISFLNYPHMEVIVVDNASSDNAIHRLVTERYPHYRFIREDRPGLDWARNCALEAAKGDIIAFTDDDTLVDPGWATAIARVFRDEPGIMAVTGLVVPFELETTAQRLFERYGGFGRGFRRRWARVGASESSRWGSYGTGQYGTGANMAFRRAFFELAGGFDPALDVGTVTNGGGDLEMFYRVLREGYTLVYEPRAVVRHCHRREYKQLRSQITNNGIGLVSYFVRSCIDQPQDRWSFIRLWSWWLHHWHLARLLRSFLQQPDIPRDLILTEFYGFFCGLGRYFRSRKEAVKLSNGRQTDIAGKGKGGAIEMDKYQDMESCAVRLIDLAIPLPRLDDITDYWQTRLYVVNGLSYMGSIAFKNRYQAVGPGELADRIVQHFGLRLLDPERRSSKDFLRTRVVEQLSARLGFFGKEEVSEKTLSTYLSVSIVIATFDRPEALRRCLSSLMDLKINRSLEIIVIDNHPVSGVTQPVVAEFSSIKYLSEHRRGLSYARNCGILAANGQIIVTIDDDVIVPSDWLELLIQPFARPNVAAVTGNILPWSLKTRAQLLFETYGGLGRGPRRQEADIKWAESFRTEAVPTWRLGATANAAFRAEIFFENRIGLFNEILGAGSPTGCSEDTEFFYKILRARRTIIYQPNAYVWHDHRQTMRDFGRQIYAYSKGHVSYHLVVLFRYKDLRSLKRIFFHLPRWWFSQIYRWLHNIIRLKRPRWPLHLTIIEISGYLAGPWCLIRSVFRVRKLGRSDTQRQRGNLSTGRQN